MTFSNNTILISGGSSGIGLGFAKKFLELGNQVIITSRSKKKLDSLVNSHPNLYGYIVDVTNVESVYSLKEQVLLDFPNLNVLFNSAGIMKSFDLFDDNVNPQMLHSEINTNLIGTINMTKVFLSHLIKQNTPLIINVSSGLSYVSSAAHPIYSGTKSAVHMFTDAVREQAIYKGYNHLTVMELVPPLVAETNLEEHAPIDAPNNMKLSDLIDQSIEAIQQKVIRLDAGYAKEMHRQALKDSDTFTHTTAQVMLPRYFS